MRRGLWLIPLLALSFLVQLPLPAYAAGPAFVQGGSHGVVSGSSTTANLNGVAANDEIVAVVTDVTSVSNGTASFGDNKGQPTYSVAVHKYANLAGVFMNIFVYYSPAKTVSGNYVFTVSNSGGTVAYLAIVVGEWSGLGPYVDGTATSSGSCAPNFPSLASTAYPNNSVLIEGAYSDNSGANPSASTGYLLIASSPTTANGAEGGGKDDITAGPGTTTFGPMGGCNSGHYVALGAVMDSAPGGTVVVTIIAGCNFFQLQCWWYPLLFMGLYSGFILMVSSRLGTSPRGKAHLFLSAVTYGSLVAVIFGIMNIVFPLLMLILNTIIALRLRG